MKNQFVILAVLVLGSVFYWLISGSFWDGLFILMSAVFLAVWAMAWRSIFQKAGYKGKYGLLMFVPIANLVLLFLFAFKEWPLEKRAREQEQDLVQGTRRKSE